MRILLMLMLLWMTAPVQSEELKELQLPILCGDSENILNGLRQQYAEELIFMAPSVNSAGHNLFHSLWYNRQTSTWSFIVVNKQAKKLCIISSGDGGVIFEADTI
jgi:hypothetical protein